MGKRDNHGDRPYAIAYIKGERRLADSAKTLDGAMARVVVRLAKRHNRGERAEIWFNGALVFSSGVMQWQK